MIGLMEIDDGSFKYFSFTWRLLWENKRAISQEKRHPILLNTRSSGREVQGGLKEPA